MLPPRPSESRRRTATSLAVSPAGGSRELRGPHGTARHKRSFSRTLSALGRAVKADQAEHPALGLSNPSFPDLLNDRQVLNIPLLNGHLISCPLGRAAAQRGPEPAVPPRGAILLRS